MENNDKLNEQNNVSDQDLNVSDENLEAAPGGGLFSSSLKSGTALIQGTEKSGILFNTIKTVSPELEAEAHRIGLMTHQIPEQLMGTARTGLSKSGKKIVGGGSVLGVGGTQQAIQHKDQIKDALTDAFDS